MNQEFIISLHSLTTPPLNKAFTYKQRRVSLFILNVGVAAIEQEKADIVYKAISYCHQERRLPFQSGLFPGAGAGGWNTEEQNTVEAGQFIRPDSVELFGGKPEGLRTFQSYCKDVLIWLCCGFMQGKPALRIGFFKRRAVPRQLCQGLFLAWDGLRQTHLPLLKIYIKQFFLRGWFMGMENQWLTSAHEAFWIIHWKNLLNINDLNISNIILSYEQ